MRRKAVPQSVRGRGLWEAEMRAQRLHLPLHQAGAERPSAGADKERTFLHHRVGAGGQVIGDRFTHRGQDRDEALLSALAGDHQHLAQWRLASGQPQRFGNPQATAIEQRQDRRVAHALPAVAGHLAGGAEGAGGVVDRSTALGWRAAAWANAERRVPLSKRGRGAAETARTPAARTVPWPASCALCPLRRVERDRRGNLPGRSASIAARLGSSPKCSVRKSKKNARSRP